ncbi:MAG: sulfatase-like hydrolase/transferase [Helicobacteraceae bacterium]
MKALKTLFSFAVFIAVFSAQAQAASAFEDEKRAILNFSPEKNVLVFFLDAFRSDDIEDILNSQKDVLKEYTGFTWYPNTLSSGACTADSIGAVLGGHYYSVHNIQMRGGIPQDEVNRAYEVLPRAFNKAGYEVSFFEPQFLTKKPENVYTYYANPKYDETYTLNTKDLTSSIETKMLYAVSLFKALPLFAKSPMYADGTWLGLLSRGQKNISDTLYKSGHWGFLKLLTSTPGFTNKQKTLKYLQFQIPHPPNTMTNSGDYDTVRSSGYIESIIALKKIAELLQKLKAQGIYDKTKIILMSDHGWRKSTHNRIDVRFSQLIPSGFDERIVTGRVNPLLMVKDFNEQGALKRSDLFMSNADVPSIVCSTLDDGCGIRDTDPTKTARLGANRKLIISSSSVSYSQDKHYPVRDEWEVTGNIFELKNWKRLK